MLTDVQGLSVSTDSNAAIAALDRFINQALSYGNAAEPAILASIEQDPTWGLAQACAAAYYLTGENAEMRQRAMPHVQAARRCLTAANVREQLYIKGILAWAVADIDTAIVYHEAIAHQFPRDLLSVQQGQYHYFYRGESVKLLAIAERALSANPDNHYLYGMVAFGLEQCHRLEEAEAMGRQATAMNRHDPWAHHAVAHVLETQGRLEDGIAWMEDLADVWESCNSMLYTHNWWHVALYYLAKGDYPTVLNLFDTRVWGHADHSSPKDQVGAIATLLRLELRGVSVGDRWQALLPYLLPRLEEHALPFQDLHYVYAFARAERRDLTQTMLQAMHSHATTLPKNQQSAWLEVALPAARGLAAHACGHWREAIAYLKPVLPQLWAIGGSHAQRDLFDQIYRDAYQQTEHHSNVLVSLQQRAVA
jgi:tetratricopeptide (TPR) repeat protein